MNDFYVYGLFYEEQEKEICFYVGKGTKYRLNEHLYKYERKEVENTHKRRKIKKLRRNNKNPYPRKIITDLTEEKAIKNESALIKQIGIENLTNHIIEDEKRVSAKGENQHKSKLTQKEVKEIKWLAEHADMKGGKIAEKYKVDDGHPFKIRQEKIWKHINEKQRPKWYDGKKYKTYEEKKSAIYKKTRSRSITGKDVKQIRWLYDNDVLVKNVADLYDISRSYCYRLADRKKRKDVQEKERPPEAIIERIMKRQNK